MLFIETIVKVQLQSFVGGEGDRKSVTLSLEKQNLRRFCAS